MDPVIEFVNRRFAERQHEAERKQARKNLMPIFISAAVAVAFLLFTMTRLAHPALGITVMIAALMVGCYNLGLCVRFGGKAVR